MFTVILVADVILAIILVGLVLIQRSDGALGSIGGGASSMMSTRAKGNFLTKATAIVAALFMFCSVVLCIMTKHDEKSSASILATEQVPAKGTASAPAVPTAPVAPAAPVKPAAPAAPVTAD